MAVKIALDSFLAVLKRSNLVPPDRLPALLEAYQRLSATTNDARRFAEFLVQQKALTAWQADKLLQGKHKGFFLGNYRLLALAGKGGMSSVYLAEHKVMKRRCAIKVLPTRRLQNASYLARFHREAQAVASLDHRNIVRAYDVDHETDGDMDIHFLVMEFVEGTGLLDLVLSCPESRLPPVVAAEYIRQAALGLQHAHAAGLVHRDVKPGNLLVDTTGTVKVLDLGLARFFETGDEISLTVQHDERVLGTADYLAPEQAVDSHQVDARADIYSLGCTLYLCLAGRPPFTQGTLAQRLLAHQTREPPAIETLQPEIPVALAEIVRKMMAKDPADRYQSAAEVAAALEAWLKTTPRTDFDRTFAGLDRLTPNPPQRSQAASGDDTVRPGSRDDALQTPLVERRPKESPKRLKASRPKPQPPRSDLVAGGDHGTPGKASAIRLDEQETTIGGPPEHPHPVVVPEPALMETRFASDPEQEIATDSPFAIDLPIDPDDSFVRRNSKQRTSTIVTLWAGLNKRQRQTVVTWGSVGLGTLVLLLLAAWAMFQPAGTSPQSTETQPTPPAPTPVVERNLGPEITVGEQGDFPTIAAALVYVSKHRERFAGDSTKPSWTITLAGGTEYDDAIRIRSSDDLALPEWLSIVSSGETPAVLRPAGNGPVIELEGAEKLTIRGFALDGRDRPSVVRLAGFLVDTRLEDLDVRHIGNVGIEWQDVSGLPGSPLQLTRLRMSGASADATAMRMGDVRQLRIDGCRFIGPLQNGIEFTADVWNHDVSIRHCLFHDIQSAVCFTGDAQDVQRIELVNNTFHRVQRGLEFREMPQVGSSGLAVHHNLFIDATEAEALIRTGYDAARAADLLAGAMNNWTDRPAASVPDGSVEIDVFSEGRRDVQDPAFASTDPSNAEFLKPTSPSIANSVKSAAPGADPIVGAIAP